MKGWEKEAWGRVKNVCCIVSARLLVRNGLILYTQERSMVPLYIYTHTHIYIFLLRLLSHTSIRLCEYVCVCTRTQCVSKRAHTHIYTHTHIHTYTHTNTHTHTPTPTHTQTHTHCTDSSLNDNWDDICTLQGQSKDWFLGSEILYNLIHPYVWCHKVRVF